MFEHKVEAAAPTEIKSGRSIGEICPSIGPFLVPLVCPSVQELGPKRPGSVPWRLLIQELTLSDQNVDILGSVGVIKIWVLMAFISHYTT